MNKTEVVILEYNFIISKEQNNLSKHIMAIFLTKEFNKVYTKFPKKKVITSNNNICGSRSNGLRIICDPNHHVNVMHVLLRQNVYWSKSTSTILSVSMLR